MKNKSINSLISKIILTGLIFGTLPVHLTLNGKNPAPQEIKNEIQQKIKTINKAVNGLKFARIFVPIMVIGAGAAFATVVIAGAIGLGVVTKKVFPKIEWVIKEITKQIDLYQQRLDLQKWIRAEWKDVIEILQNKDPRLKNLIKTSFMPPVVSTTWGFKILEFSQKKPLFKSLIKEILNKGRQTTTEILNKGTAADKVKAFKEEINKLKLPIKKLEAIITQQKQKKLSQQVKKALPFGLLGIALAGFAGSIAVSLWPIFGLSSALVNKASRGVAWLEQIKKEYPGILTPKQEQSLKKFKKLSKNTKVQAIIQNLRLETARNTAISVHMSKYAGLLAALGEKKARKLFLDYFKLKGKESIFQQALAKDAKTAKLLGMRRKLDAAQKKINDIERQHAPLKQALQNAFKMYKEQADTILEELKKEILEAQKKKSKLQIAPKPIISL